ncbi:MAG: hypothetical protein AB1861_22555 [Cyanobacteriota bacterium]
MPSSLLTICLIQIQMIAPPMEAIATSDGGNDRGLLGVADHVPSNLLTICLIQIQMMASPTLAIATLDSSRDRGLLGVGDGSDRRLGQQ